MNARKGERAKETNWVVVRPLGRERERENLHAGLKGKELLHYDAAE